MNIPFDIIKPDDNLEEQIINMCKRCEVIIEPTFFNYIHMICVLS